MKKIFLLLALAFSVPAIAQTCGDFEQFNKGVTYTMTSYNGKDKVTGTTTTTVDNASKTATGASADLTQVTKDEKGKETGTIKSTVTCDNGTYSVDMKSFVSPEMKEGYKNMDLKFEGNALNYPPTMAVGQTLPDGQVKMMAAQNGAAFGTTVVDIKDRKVEAKETITTGAGTFECFKITYTIDLNSMMILPTGGEMKMPGLKPRQVTEWFSFKVGAVKSETWKGDKKEGYTVLTALTK
ncbi:MAG: hypothetical protein FD123_4233 [Bacteroidetes bacterium]|nr:MAG: hypothetical protein FD123_4233 [Bacteroidota bacterium]